MDARLVWNTWRTILRDDALADAVQVPAKAPDVAPGLDDRQRAILAAYASDPPAAAVNIGMFRRGLIRNALTALNLVPLSRRLLAASGLDAHEVAQQFSAARQYRDDGPNFWRTAAEFVAFLACQPQFGAPAWQSALALDQAAIALVRRLAETAPAIWPEQAAAQADRALKDTRYFTSSAVVLVASDVDLTPWLEDSDAFDAGAHLSAVRQHWLIYLANPDAAPAYAELSERAARVLTLLEAPRNAAELAPALDLPPAELLGVIDSLLELGAVSCLQPNGASALPMSSTTTR